ncbi:membrane metallopeptidase [Modestobacter italicus]|uniref:Membrane metallopeptidase n=1 Tax=Modestobacter italicus (strain DSM 44449 / CECT 9708 / BC 501) TaxID=2732864 RepID=I4EZM4_MODI5|nr:M28 family peptidase [Modestobacter marinus]CCH88837.1 membrane metallopeptidase [Modestobacter marinus]
MRAGRLLGLVALLLLGALAALSIAALQPPAPAPVDAPADEFSAGRAFEHVQQLAAETHVTGSPANDRVRRYVVDTLQGLGLQTRVQDAVGADPGDPGEVEMARVRNVVAVLPGTDPTGRLFLVAHHDSVETGPGGNDDAAGVSSVLETVRALSQGPRLRNDVVVVLTDAEEACLCGAEAFADADPLAADGGVVLNLEARGTGGPPIMFETALGNADLAGVYAGAAPHPVATSFAVEVYRALPNDTDFSPLLAAGFTGLNTAYIDGSAAYHTPEDTPERMDRGSLQAMGDNTLALTRALGDDDLGALAEPAAGDAVYFPVLGGLVRYPGALVWPVAGLAVVAVGALAVVARRRTGTSLRRSLAGFGLAAVPVVLAPLAAQGAWALLVAVRPGYAGLIDPWRPGWYRLGVVALVLAVLLVWYALLRRRVGADALAVGGLGWLAVLGVVLAAAAPGGSYLTAVPALVAALVGVVGLLETPAWVRPLAGLVAGAVAVLVLAPTIALFFPALGLATGAAPALFAVLLGLVLLPVLEPLFGSTGAGRAARALVPGVAVLLTLALFGTGLAVDRFDAAHPVPTQLMYALDADRGEAWWISTEDDPVGWTAAYLDGSEDLSGTFPLLAGGLATGAAEPADLPAPTLTASATDLGDGRREVSVQVGSRRAARLLVLDVAGARVTGATVAGRAVPGGVLGEDRLSVTFHAPPDGGVAATFVVEGDGPVTVRAIDGSDGLADLPGFTPRPEGVGVAGTHTSDLLLVVTSRTL